MGKYELEFRRVEEQLRARKTKIKHQDAVDTLALICEMADKKVYNQKISMLLLCIVSLCLGLTLGNTL